ncbi:MAG: serine/threonine protein kinase [Myxococcales bacterium]|nr:serine/threonine protein kinase [Myxococcales bacterium]
MRETLRPRVRAETADLPARAPSQPGLSEDDLKTEALNLEDLEDLGSLLDDAEAGIDQIVAFESQQPAAQEPLPSARPPDEPTRKLPTIGMFGPYAIVGRLALGGMAEILLAREESEGAGGRYLVVKRILAEYEKDASFVEMFLDEARVMMRLAHPNVTHVYRFGRQDGTHYIAMEYVAGASFGKLIRKARKSGGVPVHVACKIISLVAEALDHAHNARNEDGSELGIVHRDVTPDNIMVSYDGAVKLLDFGIAKAATRAHKTQAGVVKGKFAYMAPEQCRAKDLDHRVDIFAMGVCLYEAVTGRPLYRRETEFETMEAIVRGPVPKLADRVRNPPPELEEIIERCLAKKPEDRYQSAGELQEALQTYIAKRGKVVTARRIKELMSKLFAEEMRRGPTVDTTPFGSSFHMGSDVASMLAFSTGDGEALPDELPVPDIPLVDDPFAIGPPAADPMDARPGGAGSLSSMAGGSLYQPDPVGPAVSHPLAKDRRPAPTAPGRAIHAPPPETGGGAKVAMLAVVGLLLLGGIGAGVWFFVLRPPDAPVAVDPGPAPVHTGTLSIDSTPSGAQLFVDDAARGTTPTVVADLGTGSHRVRLVLEGYVEHTGQVEIRADQTLEVDQALESEAPEEQGPMETGVLNLTSAPSGLHVFLNGNDLGATPLRGVRVPAGLIALELEMPGGERQRRGVMIAPNDTTSTHLDLRP